MSRPTPLAIASAVVIGLAAIVAPSPVVSPAVALGLVANPDTISTRHDRLAVVGAPGVLANDLNLLTGTDAVLVSGTTHGTVNLATDGGYTYQPAAGFVGQDIFRYRDCCTLGLPSNTTTVKITVTNAAPVAVNDSYIATTGVTLSVPAPGVLANDHDSDGDSLTASLVDGGGNGSLDFNADGSFTFKSGGSFTGTRTFTYRVSDGIAPSAIATVSIQVSGAPSPTPTPVPSPTPTPVPTQAPTPTPTPIPLPTPTLPPLPSIPLPTPTLPPLPSLPIPTPTLPVPTPTLPLGATPTPPPSATPTPAPGESTPPTSSQPPGSSDSPQASDATSSGGPLPGSGGGSTVPSPGSGSATGGSGGRTSGANPLDGFSVGGGALAPFGLIDGGIGAFDGLDWAIPALFLTVPGLLLILAVSAQLFAGVLWLPVARRWLGGFGVGARRRRQRGQPR